jgi:hypothetical protein
MLATLIAMTMAGIIFLNGDDLYLFLLQILFGGSG